jgi:uncharacterized protein (DUF58 family)
LISPHNFFRVALIHGSNFVSLIFSTRNILLDEQKPATRLQVRLTPEGWVFVVILCFVTVSAILRNVNLLVVLAGMMIAALLLSWRCQVYILKRLSVRRVIPQHVHAGELINIQWECHNGSRRLAAWHVNIEDYLHRAAPALRDKEPDKRQQKKLQRRTRSRATVSFAEVLPGRSMFASYKTMFANRGSFLVGDARVSTRFPFGLMEATRKQVGVKPIIVAPRLGTLSPQWDQRLRAIAVGNESVKRRRGIQEDEFYALRRWRPGDHFRHIHWRTTAKYGRPMIKQFDQPSNRDLAIVVDLYTPNPASSLGPEFSDSDRWALCCETALSFTATVLSKLGNQVQGQIAIGICGERTDVLIDRYHGEFVSEVMRALAIGQAGSETELGKTIVKLGDSVSAGTPLYVISPRGLPTAFDQWRISELELAHVRPLLRWLQVGSADFDALFSDEAPNEIRRIRQIHETWMSHVSG